MKYKVGDRVIGTQRCDKNISGLKGKIINYSDDGCFCVEFDEFICGHNCGGVGKQGHCWWIGSDNVRRIDDKKIVITTDGEETLARLYEDGKVVKSATAKCSPKDEFDFNIGARLAFDRLFETTEEKKEEYYNGKVVCVESERSCFTVGKIYEFIDGTVVDNDGDVRYEVMRIKHPSEIVRIFKFIPLVEEKKGE